MATTTELSRVRARHRSWRPFGRVDLASPDGAADPPPFAISYGVASASRYSFAVAMATLDLTGPLTFEPIFMERIWGGRRLESEFGKKLPAQKRIGESWEIVDRSEAQGVVRSGPQRGTTLHELWTKHREEVFGHVVAADRFPLLIKLLDAQDKLSLQVHPPTAIAKQLGGEPKTEFWYIARADPEAEIFAGLKKPTTRDEFQHALTAGTVADYAYAVRVKAGDAMFLPAGRFHAIGGGNLIVEVQENSDTTYRVFDWNRVDENGKPRTLHVEQALQSIDFSDCRPELIRPKGELLVRDKLFEIQKWTLDQPRQIAPPGRFVIVCCLQGALRCVDIELGPGEFFLVPAQLPERAIEPVKPGTTLLRVTIPAQA